MNPLLWCHVIYVCWQCTSYSNSRQVYPHQHEWDELTLHLSLSVSGSGWFITAISSVSDEWWMSIYTKAARTGYFIALFFFSVYDLLTVWARARRKVSRRQWFNCVHVCQISQSVCDLHLLLYARKVTAAVLSQGWFHEVIPCANGWIDGVTSVDAY